MEAYCNTNDYKINAGINKYMQLTLKQSSKTEHHIKLPSDDS